jgi:hypothetical protein
MLCFISLSSKQKTYFPMTAVIGTYDNVEKALAAIQELIAAGYPSDNLSLTGRLGSEVYTHGSHHAGTTETVNRNDASNATTKTMAVLRKSAIFGVPELGYLFAGGALISYMAYSVRSEEMIDLATILESFGFEDVVAERYANDIKKGKYMVIAHGSHNEITKATQVLEKHITYAEAEGDVVEGFNLGKWLKSLNTDFPLAGS